MRLEQGPGISPAQVGPGYYGNPSLTIKKPGSKKIQRTVEKVLNQRKELVQKKTLPPWEKLNLLILDGSHTTAICQLLPFFEDPITRIPKNWDYFFSLLQMMESRNCFGELNSNQQATLLQLRTWIWENASPEQAKLLQPEEKEEFIVSSLT